MLQDLDAQGDVFHGAQCKLVCSSCMVQDCRSNTLSAEVCANMLQRDCSLLRIVSLHQCCVCREGCNDHVPRSCYQLSGLWHVHIGCFRAHDASMRFSMVNSFACILLVCSLLFVFMWILQQGFSLMMLCSIPACSLYCHAMKTQYRHCPLSSGVQFISAC